MKTNARHKPKSGAKKLGRWYGPVKVATAGTYSQVKRPRPKKKQG